MARLINLLDPDNSSADYIGVTYPNDTTEVYTYKRINASGATVLVITVVYTDNTKVNIASILRAPTRA